MTYIKLTELTVDARHYHLLRSFEAADGKPSTFSEVKTRAEFGAYAHAPEAVKKGELKLDPIFQTALNMGEIKCVQGGYVLTERGAAQIPQIMDRLEARFAG